MDIEKIRQGNRRALAKAITLVESKLDSHRVQAQEILEQALPYSGNSIRIGITGIPGVGKSTFIETFGRPVAESLAVYHHHHNHSHDLHGDVVSADHDDHAECSHAHH